MHEQVIAADTQPCIWMAAGLISYRLCTHDFDCESCELDAALQGDLRARFNGTMRMRCVARWAVPEDRLYSTTHLWLLQQHDETWRLGIDAFAAALIGGVTTIVMDSSPNLQPRRSPFCAIDTGLGSLSLSLPLPGRIARCNLDLLHTPELLLSDPYDTGWIVEVVAPHNVVLEELISAAAARTQAALDLRRFRRAVAIHLFADATGIDPTSTENERPGDLRQVIAGDGYLELLRQFLH